MATSFATLIAVARRHLIETTAKFWSDDELAALLSLGAKDLWKGLNDLYLDHFLTIEETSASLPANTATVSSVPSDVVRIGHIEPKSLSTFTNLFFRPLKFKDPLFMMARAQSAVDPVNVTIWYDILHEGAPVSAPTIYCAPQVTSAVALRVLYVPTLAAMTTASSNPIPGESDNAMIAWCVAYARAKEREDRAPDPEWLSVYATEKQNLIVSVDPRQTAEEKYVEPVFGAYWDN